MRILVPALAGLIVLGGLVPAFALSDAEYHALLASSGKFRQADAELAATWREVYNELTGAPKQKALAEQRQWLKTGRDAAARKFMEAGATKEEAYTEAAQNRTDALKVLQYQHRQATPQETRP